MANINGVNPPAINDVDYVDKITNSLNAIDNHDHSSGKGVPIASGAFAPGAIVNADISGSAAIATSKLAALTVSRAIVTSGTGLLAVATTTAAEIGFVAGVSSAIQTQIDGKQPLDADLTAIAALASTGLIARTGSGTAAERTITGTTNQISVTNGSGASGNPTVAIASDAILPGTGAVIPPTGTTAQRPGSPTAGMIRYNTDLAALEAYQLGVWGPVGGVSLSNSTFTGTTITTGTDAVQKYRYTGVSAQVLSALTFSALPDGGRVIITGSSDTNTLTIPVGITNMSINGERVLTQYSTIELVKDGTQLIEVSRNGI